MSQTDQPHDPLTELGGVMLEAFKQALPPGLPNTRVIVVISREIDGKQQGGIAMTGYGPPPLSNDAAAQVLNDLLTHARAILRERGHDLQVIAMGGGRPAPSAPEA